MARRRLPVHPDQLEQALRTAFADALKTAVTHVRAGRSRAPYFEARRALTEHLVSTAILYCAGDKRRAAKWLGVSYSTVKQFS